MSSQNPCKPGPGKFEGETALTALAYWHATSGNADSDIGRYSFFRAPFNFDADSEAVEFATALGFCSECIADALDDARGLFGLVVWEDSNGFVYVRELGSAEEYDEAGELASEESESEAD